MPWQNKKNWAHGFLKDSSENIIENHSLLIKSAVKTNRKPNPLLFERGQWQHVENHIHCLVKQQWQHMEILPLLTKFALTAQEKLHPLMFERKQWQHVENPIHCLVHYIDKMGNHPLLFERGHWQHVENHIHCLVKQQSQQMEIHPVLTKCALKAREKQHLPMFEREQWQHVENPIHCLVHSSDNISNTFHCLLSVLWKHAENQIHSFLREGCDNMWKTTYTA